MHGITGQAYEITATLRTPSYLPYLCNTGYYQHRLYGVYILWWHYSEAWAWMEWLLWVWRARKLTSIVPNSKNNITYKDCGSQTSPISGDLLLSRVYSVACIAGYFYYLLPASQHAVVAYVPVEHDAIVASSEHIHFCTSKRYWKHFICFNKFCNTICIEALNAIECK